MYTDSKVYQIIIALLKEYGIRHCVLSAGSRNVPFVHSVETDEYFKCYSVVDERSAGYFALGLAQELNEPVVISCTSSTATCNYWPAIAEAYYQNVPLVILTSDRNPHMLGQWEDQMIDQVGMYDRHVKKSVNLPLDAEEKDDFIYCQRLVNEALLELNHNTKGPVHINIPMKGYNMNFSTHELPKVTKIDRLNVFDDGYIWKNKIEKLENASRILIVCGQNSFVSDELRNSMEMFFQKYNSAISIEYMSNVKCDGCINTSLCMESRFITKNKFMEFLPDIVISFGGNVMSGIKEMLRQTAGMYEHWLIQEDGKVVDLFKSITTIFETTPQYFFEYCNNHNKNKKNDKKYYNLLMEYNNKITKFNIEYSGMYAIKKVVECIPEESLLHLSINDSIRITNMCKLNPNIKVYANIGTYGIDGSMSSFIGQSVANINKKAFLIIGDLSFFYDMNSLKIKHIGNNVRIMLINNQGGSEFYYNGSWQDDKSDLHTCARHNTKAEGWAKSVGFEYISANDVKSFDEMKQKFLIDNSDKPILFEVFTEMKTDAETIYKVYEDNMQLNKREIAIKKGKKFIKKIIGKEIISKIKRNKK